MYAQPKRFTANIVSFTQPSFEYFFFSFIHLMWPAYISCMHIMQHINKFTWIQRHKRHTDFSHLNRFCCCRSFMVLFSTERKLTPVWCQTKCLCFHCAMLCAAVKFVCICGCLWYRTYISAAIMCSP